MDNHIKHVLENKAFVMVWPKEILARHVLEHKAFLGWSAEPADRGVDSSGMGRLSGTADLSSGRSRDRQLGSGSAVWDGRPGERPTEGSTAQEWIGRLVARTGRGLSLPQLDLRTSGPAKKALCLCAVSPAPG